MRFRNYMQQDTVPAMMRPGEGVLVPEATRAFGGPQGINFINRAAERGGLSVQFPRRFGRGGVVSGDDSDERIGPVPPSPEMWQWQSLQRFQSGGVAYEPIEKDYVEPLDSPSLEEFSQGASLRSIAHPKSDLDYKLLQPGQLYLDPDDGKIYRKGYNKPTVI